MQARATVHTRMAVRTMAVRVWTMAVTLELPTLTADARSSTIYNRGTSRLTIDIRGSTS